MNDKTKEEYRQMWARGPWDNEPDRVEFESHGFPCLILRQDELGHLCGYVGVPPGHPAHGKDYNDVGVDIHGGLTYGRPCDGDLVCHKAKPGEPDDVWWLGFDCAHYDDCGPFGLGFSEAYRKANQEFAEYFKSRDSRNYKTVGWVREETERLAAQLAEMR